MSVITISREFGSVGDDIGERIAQGLGYHFVDKEFIGDLLSQYGLVNFESEFETPPSFWEGFNAQRGQRRGAMVSMLNRVVQAVACHGDVVIQGRSGFAMLRGGCRRSPCTNVGASLCPRRTRDDPKADDSRAGSGVRERWR